LESLVRPTPASPALSIPRFGYGILIGAACLAAIVLGLTTTLLLGGTQPSVLLLVAALAGGTLVALLPAVLVIGADFWGVTVMLAGVARGLLVLGVVFVATENNPDLSKRAIYLGALAGTVLVLIVETAAAVSILSRLERAKAALKAGPSPATSHSAEHA
jgi:hypothetical protein